MRRLAVVLGSVGLSIALGGVARAAPKPATPSFAKSIDAFASYDAQDTCDPTAKPGTKDFRDFILATYPSTGDYGITRACNIGGTSEHKEGRAWDWKVDYYNTAQRDIADTVIDWMLASDEHGNACALARRLGVMYFIWNKEIWGAYRSPNSSCASAGWKAYTGSNPHTDHVHISWAWPGANKQTTWWTAPLPSNQKPKGYLDGAACDRVWGWSQDPDAPTKSIDVHLYFGGPAGDASAQGVPVTANVHRDDLCGALGSCEHGYEVASPLSLHDGKPHVVHAYGIDSAGGTNPELSNSPGTLQCDPVIPSGVRRHVTNGESFEAWGFSYFWDVMPVADADLDAIDQGPNVPAAPLLVKSDDGDPHVWLIDGEGTVRRHVPNGNVMDAWGFDWNAIVTWTKADVEALPEGPVVRASPVLVQGSGAAVYLMDDALPSGAGAGGSSSVGGSSGSSGFAGAGGSGSGSAGTKSGSGGGQQSRVIGEEESGCACRSAGSRGTPSAAWLGLFALVFVGRRMRR